MLRIAFKEWAVICRALSEGRQALILRKGGIAEHGGQFSPEHDRFWLYPTYTHQQRDGIKPDAANLLCAAEAERPSKGALRLTHFVTVSGVYYVKQLFGALLLDHLHVWSEATVRQRFAYRSPGIYVLPARVYRAAAAIDLPERLEYAGCHTWVDLERDLPTDEATPVLTDTSFNELRETLDRRLTPITQV